ncbi:hypothetical protein SASPL_105316 [Salvia splendens]|uniref:Reverse transcriptase Ty1/copia-type domain-containing protein n=1 Tax=Salvia splendens TaxID=180675 RepID=A0A8X8YJM6_SALSN|nr:hypothetical protein SASPL_105316 [Salvia splendens]
MASNGSSMSATQPLIPVFKGEGYEYWSIRMQTLLRSQDLCDFVEQGYADSDEANRLRENKKKDSKALAIIQQAVHDNVFSRIATTTTSKQAWLTLQKEFKELMGSLQAHESRINRSFEKSDEKAFQVKDAVDVLNDVWFVDSGCSNHMCSNKEMFKELDESRKIQVRLGDDKSIQVEGKGTVAVKAKHLPNSLWAEAVATAIFLLNISPTKAVLNRTPYEAWGGTKPTVSHLKVFGCVVDVTFHEDAGWDWESKQDDSYTLFPLDSTDADSGQDGFERSANEPTLYAKKGNNGSLLLVCVYVDDIIYMGSSNSLVTEFKESMMNMFEMTDLGLLNYFLGLEIKQGEDGVFVFQKKYAEDLLKRFNMTNCKAAITPMNLNEKLQLKGGTEEANAASFRSLVGGLIYLTHMRPHIAFVVGMVSRFMHNPTRQHFGPAKRILRYVAGTQSFGIWYSNVAEFELVGFTDSDWAGSVDDRRSTSGFVFNLGSGAVTWSSKKQGVTTLSTAEAEYVDATSSACQGVWLRRLLADFEQE